MSSANTFGGWVGPFPALANLAAVETVFPYPIAQGVGTGSPAFPTGSSAVLAIRPDISGSSLDGRPFLVRVAGKATGGASAGALTINLYVVGTTVVNPATVPVSGNKIATLATSSLTAASGNFDLEATLMWDSVSQVLQGSQFKLGTGVTPAVAVLTNTPTVTSIAGLQFVASAVFAGGTAGSVVLTEFSAAQD